MACYCGELFEGVSTAHMLICPRCGEPLVLSYPNPVEIAEMFADLDEVIAEHD